ncbi:MAG: hypothetical protein ACI391_04550 [Muribaculaceae bacterium]
MEVSQLIQEAECILHRIKVGDIFNDGSEQEYLNDEDLAFATRWSQHIHDFGVQSSNQLARELCDLWIINHNRVSSISIKRAIDILEQLSADGSNH